MREPERVKEQGSVHETGTVSVQNPECVPGRDEGLRKGWVFQLVTFGNAVCSDYLTEILYFSVIQYLFRRTLGNSGLSTTFSFHQKLLVRWSLFSSYLFDLFFNLKNFVQLY